MRAYPFRQHAEFVAKTVQENARLRSYLIVTPLAQDRVVPYFLGAKRAVLCFRALIIRSRRALVMLASSAMTMM